MATFLLFAMLILSSVSQLSQPASALSKDQLTCTMCSSCENSCQPIYSPPPPPSVPANPPPKGGGGGGGGLYYFSPPPPAVTSYYPPPYAGGGYGTPPPPNPMFPFLPFYYHIPPPPSAQQLQPYGSNSLKLKTQPLVSSLSIFFSLLFCLRN